jgi:pimeloyl-ACP methyl ester carboxylesterase
MIDELDFLNVNGIRQWILIRGRDLSRPTLLFVHGGPGYPLMWFSRAFDGPLLEDFVVVHWDQPNAGKSYSPDISPEPLTLARIATDGLQVAEHIVQRLKTERIILAGHSWGTMVAADMARQRPELFTAYVSVGTSARWTPAYELRFAHLCQLARQQGDFQAMQHLEDLGPPPYDNFERVERFGQLVSDIEGFSGTARRLTELELADAIAQSTEYTPDEIARVADAVRDSYDRLGAFLNGYAMIEHVRRLELPVHFVEGRYDGNCPIALSRAYFDELDAPAGKYWHLFEESAHLPMYEEPERFLRVLNSIAANS